MIYHVIYTAKTGEVLSQYMNYPDIPTCEERLKSLGATRWEIGIDLWSVPVDEKQTKINIPAIIAQLRQIQVLVTRLDELELAEVYRVFDELGVVL